MYITASSTISHQPTFRNPGFSAKLSELNAISGILHPDYGAFIPANYRRRMSDALKMALACALDCLQQANLEQPDAVIVGTSMGCNTFTKNFLDVILSSKGGLLSPTAFTLSTHNTIAGQISLFLGNREYNMTHTQNSLSFEQALIDGLLRLDEGSRQVLAGAADEMENELYNMHARLNAPHLHLSCGASFFILSSEKTAAASVELVDAGSFGFIRDLAETVAGFLHANDLSADQIDLWLYSFSDEKTVDELRGIVPPEKLFDYQKLSGTYFTNSAFAMHYGIDILLQGKRTFSGRRMRRVLICNNLVPGNLGLILLSGL